MGADTADLSELFANNRRWAAECVARRPDFFERLKAQQAPQYLWIGCSDSRVPANDIVGRLRNAGGTSSFTILGPAPAPLVRLRGEHRVQFFLKGARRSDMRAALKAVLAELPDVRRKVTIDVDPLSVL